MLSLHGVDIREETNTAMPVNFLMEQMEWREAILEAGEVRDAGVLDKAWGLEPNSRLSCQALVGDKDLVIEIPKYTINMAKEGH